MKDSVYYNPVRMCIGQEAEKKLGGLIAPYGRRVLMVYGGSSIKKNGVYEKVAAQLQIAGLEVCEFGGVRANPVLSKVYEGIRVCREHGTEFILAVGGGSVIDTAKAIALGANYDGDVWNFFAGKEKVLPKLIPTGAVLTIPAAGSENSNGTVIMNENGNVKRSFNNENLIPKFAILNPTFTYSLPAYQTACGVTDILSHFMERYFTDIDHVAYTDALLEASMKTLMTFGPAAIREPENYDARAEIMLLGTIAQNNILGIGRAGDWGSHTMQHEMSAAFDVAHGAGLAVIFPAWMKYARLRGVGIAKLAQFATQVMDVPAGFGDAGEIADEGIRRLEQFLTGIGMPVTLQDIGIEPESIEMLVEKTFADIEKTGRFQVLRAQDVREIYRLSCKAD